MQNTIQKQLLEQMKDAHPPEAIGWWPLATGWWVLLTALIVISVALYLFFQAKRRNRKGLYTAASGELSALFLKWKADKNNTEYLNSANGILKRLLISRSNSNTVSSLSGAAWKLYLSDKNDLTLSEASLNALCFEAYKRQPSVNVSELHDELLSAIELLKKLHGKQPQLNVSENQNTQKTLKEASHA